MNKISIQKVKMCSIDELVFKIGKAFVVNDKKIALFKVSEYKVNAIENSCPHKGGELSQGIISGEFVYCPLHDWKMCTSDGVVQGPDRGCVKSYKTEIINNEVYVCLEEE